MLCAPQIESRIKKLPPHLINQIAAGEVIERPAAVIKELVENAIDAGADKIDISIRHGGKSFIQVKDNGIGMSEDDLSLAFERHATSKLTDNDLFNIHTYGFRGEALPSIASISRVSVVTKHQGQVNHLDLEAGALLSSPPHMATVWSFLTKDGINQGTCIEISDLFFATPARLKFLKTDGYETLQCVQMVKRLALTNYQVAFQLKVDDNLRLNLGKSGTIKERIHALWEDVSPDDLCFFDYTQDGLTLTGCISVPTCHRAQSDMQYFYVNGRFVKDKIFAYALKLGYGDRIPPRRFPLACVFLSLPADSVDVNVHPCKTEVRFLEESLVRRHLAAAMNGTLSFGGALQTTQRLSQDLSSIPVKKEQAFTKPYIQQRLDIFNAGSSISSGPKDYVVDYFPSHTPKNQSTSENQANILPPFYFGKAAVQVFHTYIISHTHEKTFIIDQHAAHERITYEKYKRQKDTFLKQKLAFPLAVPITPEQKNILEELKSGYTDMGFDFSIEDTKILLTSVPALIPASQYERIIQDTLDHLVHYEQGQSTDHMIDSILATMACHNSIRKGQILSVTEMDALLRAMEKTPNIAQCNHGRPTYIQLQKGQLDRLFERC